MKLHLCQLTKPTLGSETLLENIHPHPGPSLLVWSLTNREKRALEAASVPTHKANSWVRDLTQENIHPHPGPSLLVWSLNSQGAALAWSLLTRVERDKPHIVTVQEPNFTPAQAEQFLIRLSLKKYRAWHQPGSRQGTNRGGLLVAVRDDIRASLCHQSVGEFGNLLTLNMEAWMLTVVWRRPAQTQVKQALTMFWRNTATPPMIMSGALLATGTGPLMNMCSFRETNTRRVWSWMRTAVLNQPAEKVEQSTMPTAAQPSCALPHCPLHTPGGYVQWGLEIRYWDPRPVPVSNTQPEWQDFCLRAETAFRVVSQARGALNTPPVHRPKGSLPFFVQAFDSRRRPIAQILCFPQNGKSLW